MADYIQDGRTRRLTLTVDYKNSLNESIPGYPKVYSITSAFVDPGAALGGMGVPRNIAGITNVQLARINDVDYNSRLASFYNMVEADNIGLDRNTNLLPGFEPTGTSTLCPIDTPGSDDPQPID